MKLELTGREPRGRASERHQESNLRRGKNDATWSGSRVLSAGQWSPYNYRGLIATAIFAEYDIIICVGKTVKEPVPPLVYYQHILVYSHLWQIRTKRTPLYYFRAI